MEQKNWPEGIKWTKQRKDIFEVLKGAKKPLSALDIFEEKELVEKSVLLGSDTAVYELVDGHHKHYAVCLSCHKLVPLKHCPFEHVAHEAMESDDGDFVVTGHKLELYGYCKECTIEKE